jgi:hypothetical protein
MRVYRDLARAERRQACLFRMHGIATGIVQCEGGWRLLHDPDNWVSIYAV